MTKDSQPKAINIVRPGTFMGTKRLGSGSVHSGSVHSGSVVSTSSTASSRKPRVTNKIESNKPTINLYHPPSRKPSEDGRSINGRTLYNNNKPNSIPTLNHQQQQPYYLQQQHYNQQQQQQQNYIQQQPQLQPQRMTKSFTAPSLQTPHEPSRSASPSSNIIRPHRSVLGPITATSNNIHAEPEQTSFSSSSEQEEEEEEEDEEEEEEMSDDASQVSTDDDGNEPRNTARVNRQIEDLEISNQSLLTVNAMLESTVRKQASELAQFKKLMASGQLPLQDLIIPAPPPMTANEEEEEDESSDDWEKDETFQRLRKVTEMMIKQGQKAIDFEYKILGRVLADYQLEEEGDDEEEEDNQDEQVDK